MVNKRPNTFFIDSFNKYIIQNEKEKYLFTESVYVLSHRLGAPVFMRWQRTTCHTLRFFRGLYLSSSFYGPCILIKKKNGCHCNIILNVDSFYQHRGVTRSTSFLRPLMPVSCIVSIVFLILHCVLFVHQKYLPLHEEKTRSWLEKKKKKSN